MAKVLSVKEFEHDYKTVGTILLTHAGYFMTALGPDGILYRVFYRYSEPEDQVEICFPTSLYL